MNVTLRSLLTILATGTHEELKAARRALAASGDEALAPLLALLRTGSERQVANAVLVLGDLASPDAIEPLLALLSGHHHVIVRCNVAEVMGKFAHNPRIVEELIAAVQREKGLVAMWCLTSLGKQGGERTRQFLSAFIHHTASTTLRIMAIRAIGELGDPAAVEALMPYLQDHDRHVRDHASMALQKLGYNAA